MNECFTPKEQELFDLLCSLDKGEYTSNQAENLIIVEMLAVCEYDKANEVLEIVKSNLEKSLREIMIIITSSNIYPTVEIVDDDEFDENE